MAYMISITRNPQIAEGGACIALDEWVEAVNSVEGVRLAEGDYSVTLPETGQTFTLRNNGGDAEILLPYAGVWQRVFRWDDEGVTFVMTQDFADAGCHLRCVARQLADALQASVCGEEGELYP
jgi:hypothetical protein